ncbi:hypothetical protein CTI12_AA260210 [Artemisia annua]|uniref:Uncharacterized protein n=1 Tax=Artemisia annua TaxID=35608 RepID=A0A2U1NI94_ARTAN|nr:hypothetical protein CTI12_AA260210 [Artemisia annua]
MEITELNLIGDFEAGIKCLQQNPSYFTKLSLNSFWTWGALIFAIFATFNDGVDDDTPSSVADSDYESDRDLSNEVFRAEGGSSYYDQGQNGDYTLRRRNGFSWSDFSAGKSVVQLWDSFGLGLDFEDDEVGGKSPAVYAAWRPQPRATWSGEKEE